MRLRRIVVAGFKTFASRSEVRFDRGITAVVGPNGSGKSNLVDALRWGLGETNARELRGQRMDEVIYAGGGTRARVNVASVELVIDNEEGKLPVADPEVSVSRRVVRGEGDTEFRLNGERVRLRDLERVLGGTGLTQNGYAVVVQNDIDGIIESTPAQRRTLVEEAAGVRALRAACEDSLSRMRRAEQVLVRLEDLLAEAEPRQAELAGQAELAREQRSLAERLADLKGSLAREEWRAAVGRRRQARRRLELATSRGEAAAEAERGFSERAAAERARLDAARTAHEAASRRLEQARLAAERALGDALRWADRVRSGTLQRAAATAEALAHSQDVEAARRALESVPSIEDDPAFRSLDEQVDALRSAEVAAAEAVRDAEARARAAGERMAAADAVAAGGEGPRGDAAARLRAAENALAALAADAEAAAQRLAAMQRHAAGAAAASADAASGLRDAEVAFDVARAAVEQAWAAVNAADARAAELGEHSRAALARQAAARGRLEGLLGGEGGVALAVAAGTISGRRLLDCVSVLDPVDTLAIAGALEASLAAWLVDDLASAMQHLDRHGPREQLLAAGLETIAESQPPAPSRLASSAIEVRAGADGAVSRLLRGVWLVPDIASARLALRQGAAAAALPDGSVATAAGIRGGGHPADPLQLREAEREAARLAEGAGTEEAAAIAVAGRAREALSAAEAALAERAGALQGAGATAAKAEAERATAADALAAGERRLAQAGEVRAQRAGEREAATATLAAAELRHEKAALELVEARAELAAARAALAERVEESAAAAALTRDAEMAAARAHARGAGAEERREAASGSLTAAQGRRGAAEARVATAEAEVLTALARRGAAQVAVDAAGAAVAEARERAGVSAGPLPELERIVVSLENEHAAVAVDVARAEDERTAAAEELAAAEAEVLARAEAVRGEVDEDGGDFDPAAAERAEREVVRLERRLAALGPVNALAPEQHDALQTRVGELRAHRLDISLAVADVQSIARRLEVAVEQRFDTVFGAVSYHFQQIFGELFPNGRATLRLEEALPADAEEEELEAIAGRRPGVEILAQPPGKRLTPLRLLSGGERALTALAVVLALQQVNPSPFYVFDEVDAALDDSNVLRFTRLLRRLAADQQFIVVTHNHITMAAADALWGVTIDSAGVSSVLGVRFESIPESEPEPAPALRLRRAEGQAAG